MLVLVHLRTPHVVSSRVPVALLRTPASVATWNPTRSTNHNFTITWRGWRYIDIQRGSELDVCWRGRVTDVFLLNSRLPVTLIKLQTGPVVTRKRLIRDLKSSAIHVEWQHNLTLNSTTFEYLMMMKHLANIDPKGRQCAGK